MNSTRVVAGFKRCIVRLILPLTLCAVVAPTALAHGESNRGIIPNVTPCANYVWNTINGEITAEHTAGSTTYKVWVDLQQGYDPTAQVWCSTFRTNVALQSISGGGGTLVSSVEPGGGSWSNSAPNSLPSGVWGPYHYASPTIISGGCAVGQSDLKVNGSEWKDATACHNHSS